MNNNILDSKNYKKKLDKTNIEIICKYCELINEYLFHAGEHIIIQNQQYYIFVILRGLNTLTHIFNTLILYTKNINLTTYHCKKAYLYYVEFMGQISEDSHTYLQLNSKDATLFVYKKKLYVLEKLRWVLCLESSPWGQTDKSLLNRLGTLTLVATMG